ncbi:hypothetical protein ACFVTY_01860 [Streptomyces sp. NPDC058067]|uniref:hypothetical protein n=1 Tax=Streptomyces sp. NPDC058067 TaxID=3346324 RepID=UPI0036F16090
MSAPATPLAVAMFRARQLPTAVYDAIVLQADVERYIQRLRPLGSVEDHGDRETLLARHAAAAKTLAAYPSIITSAGSLS